jgi:hypothetical protein
VGIHQEGAMTAVIWACLLGFALIPGEAAAQGRLLPATEPLFAMGIAGTGAPSVAPNPTLFLASKAHEDGCSAYVPPEPKNLDPRILIPPLKSDTRHTIGRAIPKDCVDPRIFTPLIWR